MKGKNSFFFFSFNLLVVSVIFLLLSCNQGSENSGKNKGMLNNQPVFTLLGPSKTGVAFKNSIEEDRYRNILRYQYYYNGGGVAIGDINNDSLPDLFFTGNQVPNRLYLNKGNLKFKDITEQSGISLEEGASWDTGVTMADVNDDGYLDIYVCRSGHLKPFNRSNLLYINNGDNTFSEKALLYGLDDQGYSIQSVFFDYDKDGDLDMYLTNHGIRFYGRSIGGQQRAPSEFSGDKLYRNDDGFFTDISEQAGIEGADYSYGLGISVGDLNQDGWEDIYVANDFYEHDYLYVNNGDGTFSNVAWLAGMARTDWSWATLFADFDNDGLKDLFVTNGLKKDVLNKDFLTYTNKKLEEAVNPNQPQLSSELFQDLLNEMPSKKLANPMFKNTGNLTFLNATDEWGLGRPAFSNGAAYGDLDNDGDLDLVIINIDEAPFIYRNNTNNRSNAHFLKIDLKGKSGNRDALGTKVKIHLGDSVLFRQKTRTRGFQSAVKGILHFGLGRVEKVPKIGITWPDQSYQELTHVKSDQLISVSYDPEGDIVPKEEDQPGPMFRKVTTSFGVNFIHRENNYNDFLEQPLLPHKMSRLGPGMASADVNGDGKMDFFVGGAKGQAGKLFIQGSDGKFEPNEGSPWVQDQASEDMGVLFFDADGDQDPDLYVVSGGSDFLPRSPLLNDRLYINDEAANFRKARNRLPEMPSSGSCVIAGDYDGDGDPDLFVGGRGKPGEYPKASRSFLLRNDDGKFKDVTSEIAAGLEKPGMVTAALWTDYNNDDNLDLLVAGEWMPIKLFKNENGKFSDQKPFEALQGWWFSLAQGDFDVDGDMDYLAGNNGKNFRYQAGIEAPFHIFSGDFDRDNDHLDVLLAGNLYAVEPHTPRNDAGNGLVMLGNGQGKFHALDLKLSGFFAPGDVKVLEWMVKEDGALVLVANNNGPVEAFQLARNSKKVFP